MVSLDVHHKERLYSLLRIAECIAYAKSATGKIMLLEDMVDHAIEVTAAAMIKAKA